MNHNPISVRIVVADQSEARFYDAVSIAPKMKLIDTLTDPIARLHERDLVSDKPGRVFDRAPAPGQRRGAVSHHSTGGERTARKHEAMEFARRIVLQLETAHRTGAVSRLVVMAGPAFLGLLREAMSKSLHEIVVAEVCKDLVHEDDSGVLAHVPKEAFEPAFKVHYSARE